MSEKNGSSQEKPDIVALRAEIKQTRAELGETVQALAAKADVKARAKDSVEQTKAKMLEQAAETTGKVTGAVKGAAHTAGDKLRGRGAQSGALGADVRRSPIPVVAVLVGVVAAVGVILIVRGRRR